MNYGEVKAQFVALLHNRQCTPSLATTFLEAGLSRCQRELRCPAMEKSVLVTIGVDYEGLWIPSDYLELIRIENSYGTKLQRRDIDYVKFFNSTGVPEFYARQGKTWILGPTPAADDTIRIDYYAEFDPLSEDADDNLLTIIAPYLLIYSALGFAADYFLDERAQLFEARYQQILKELNLQADNDEIYDACMSQVLEYPED